MNLLLYYKVVYRHEGQRNIMIYSLENENTFIMAFQAPTSTDFARFISEFINLQLKKYMHAWMEMHSQTLYFSRKY
jgi:hypothetical protein